MAEAGQAAQRLLAEHRQAQGLPGAQQRLAAQAVPPPLLRDWTSQPGVQAAAAEAAAAARLLASPPQSPAGSRQRRKGKAVARPFPDLSSYNSVRQLYDAFVTDNAASGRVGLLKMEEQHPGWRSGKGCWQRWSEQKRFIAEIDRRAAALSQPGHPTVDGHQIADRMDAERQARRWKAIPVATFVKTTNTATCARERAEAAGGPQS